MRTQTEADSAFLDLVQGSLQASAKEAERLARSTGTTLVRVDSAQPVVPKGLLPFLIEVNPPSPEGTQRATSGAAFTVDARLEDLQQEVMGRMFSILLQELRTSRGQQIPTDKALHICVSRLDKPLAKALGGKAVLTELAGQIIDAWIANGLLTQVETATKIMLKLNREK